MNDPCFLGVVEAATAFADRKLSPAEYANALLARIDGLEERIRAWALIDRERLREEVSQQEAALAHGKAAPLAGIPLGIKDNYLTAGLETSVGSALYRGNVPKADAAAVARLRRAGAVVFGKTEMTAFAAMDAAPTRNPWNTDHTPGGSSSGSAAAVAARMCPAALGSQTAGSVLRPAAYCGVVGLKPTYGVVDRAGLVPCAWSMDHVGIFARSVADVQIVFASLDGRGPRKADDEARSSVTLGVPDRYFLDTLDAEVASAFEKTLALFARDGATVRPVKLPPSFERGVEAGIVTMYAEMAAFHRDLFAARRAEYPPRLGILVEQGLRITAGEYLRAQQIRRVMAEELSALLRDVDCLLTPTTPSPAPKGLKATGDWRFNLPFSASGHPALTLPMGFSATGLPLGLQLVARHHGEQRLFDAGRRLQLATDWHTRAPYCH